jgi:hypothetical protein
MHLIIIQNGLNGFHFAMNYVLNYYFNQLNKEEYKIVVSDVNNFLKTHDGLDEMGKRLAQFTKEKLREFNCDKISFIGHSLGGLMIRSCIFLLDQDGIFNKIEPMTYISIASPHLGIFEVVEWKKFAARWLLRITGQELLIEDQNQQLITLSSNRYLSSLNKFKYKVAYGNILGDTSVSFRSACISAVDFVNIKSEYEKHVLFEFKSQYHNLSEITFPLQIFENLNKINWIRKAVDFSDCYICHNYIIGRGLTTQTLVLDDTLQYLK